LISFTEFHPHLFSLKNKDDFTRNRSF
jgi:hypothetical protein